MTRRFRYRTDRGRGRSPAAETAGQRGVERRRSRISATAAVAASTIRAMDAAASLAGIFGAVMVPEVTGRCPGAGFPAGAERQAAVRR